MYDGCHIIRFHDGVYPVKFYRERRLMYLKFLLSGRVFPFLRTLLDVVSKYEIEVIHCANYFSSIVGAILKTVGRGPVAGDIHASAMIEARERNNQVETFFGLLIEKILVQSLDAFISPTSQCIDYFKNLTSRKQIFFVLPSCVDLSNFRPERTDEPTRLLKNSPDDIVLFYYGSPYPENVRALEMFVEVVTRSKTNNLNVIGVVAGDFGEDSIPTEGVFYSGWLSQEDLARHLNVADIAIIPLLLESKGISTRVIECMASGTPTITTANGVLGLERAVVEGSLLVADSVYDMIHIVNRLTGENKLRKKIGYEARNYVESELAPSVIARRLETIYRSVID